VGRIGAFKKVARVEAPVRDPSSRTGDIDATDASSRQGRHQNAKFASAFNRIGRFKGWLQNN